MDSQELTDHLAAAGIDPARAGDYRHFKGGLYRVHGTLPDATDDSTAVLYSNEQGRLFVRAADNFFGLTPDGRPRFEAL